MSKVLEWLSALRSLRFMRRSLADRQTEIVALRSDIERLRSDEAGRMSQARAESAEQIERLRTESMERIERLRTESTESTSQLRGELSDNLHRLCADLSDNLHRLCADLSERIGHLHDVQSRLQVVADHLTNGLERVDGEAHSLGLRMNRMAPDFPHLPNLTSGDSAGWFYASFEETFRGQREVIIERLRVYLPFLQTLRVTDSSLRAVDLGCGRGEWLELMRREGIAAVGVDENPVTVDRCLKRELHVTRADILEFLRAEADATYDLVTSFQVIEHLAPAAFIALLLEARRVLRPGGILILETPNPANLNVGAFTFHHDPTHRQPLPAPLLRFIVEWARFEVVEILTLQPDLALLDVATREGWPPTLQRLLSGPQDIGAIARAPSKPPDDQRLTQSSNEGQPP
jgi:SAM-dependent methyltransferase